MAVRTASTSIPRQVSHTSRARGTIFAALLLASGASPCQAGSVDSDSSMVGVLVAEEEVAFVAEVSARLMSMPVSMGDAVSPGDTLAVLDDSALRHELASAQAQLDVAQADERAARLAANETAEALALRTALPDVWSKTDVDQARSAANHAAAALDAERARTRAAAARVAQLETTLRATVLLAPFSGRVAERSAAVGSFVQTGQPLLRILTDDGLRVRFAAPESCIDRLVLGCTVRVSIDALAQTMTGVLTHVAPEIDAASGLLFAEADLPLSTDAGGGLRAGMVASVTLLSSTRQP